MNKNRTTGLIWMLIGIIAILLIGDVYIYIISAALILLGLFGLIMGGK